MNTLQHIQKKIISSRNKTEILSAKDLLNASTLVFTNGCFDLIHTGHIHYLAAASDLGSHLIVGLNADVSVKRLKGDSRPVKDEDNRALVLASMNFIDLVVLFDEDTPQGLIETVMPDILVKGGDYNPQEKNPQADKYIVGSDIVLNAGGKVEVINFVEGYSSSGLISKMQK